MMLQKRKDHAFGKDVYLLGRNERGELLWLEAPKWDCDWYWGFGYVEVYTGKGGKGRVSPSKASDISSHSHFNGLVDFMTEGNKYIAHLNESPRIKETVLSDSESWEICDLMKSFYTLAAAAAIFHTGGSHLSTSAVSLKSREAEDYINQVAIPAITARVLEILAPKAIEVEVAA